MRRINVERYSQDEVEANVARAIVLADENAPRESPAWRAIFRAAYDGFSGRDVILQEDTPVALDAILNGGRR